MAAYYLWFKATHIAFMVTWFAGLFYLPRLFIYHAQASDEVSHERFVIMERRLFAIMTIGALLTVILGVLLMGANPSVASQGWFHVKLVLLIRARGLSRQLPAVDAEAENRLSDGQHHWLALVQRGPRILPADHRYSCRCEAFLAFARSLAKTARQRFGHHLGVGGKPSGYT